MSSLLTEDFVLSSIQKNIHVILTEKIKQIVLKSVEEDISKITEELVQQLIGQFEIYQNPGYLTFEPKIEVHVHRKS